jgi:HTH-type transcriptional regulator, competence development regulator
MPDTLGGHLRMLRRQAGLSLRKLEAGTGVSNAYLSQLERDRIKGPSPHVLWVISECYGADYLDLLRRAGYPVPSAPRVVFAGAERLTPDEREEVQEFIAMKLRRRRDRGRDADTPTP